MGLGVTLAVGVGVSRVKERLEAVVPVIHGVPPVGSAWGGSVPTDAVAAFFIIIVLPVHPGVAPLSGQGIVQLLYKGFVFATSR